jgi:peptidoglycan/LPS O-acetylase OafA/YrhL
MPKNKNTHHMSYRKDIDGLRAVAVIAVILAHAGLHGFSGGFVGVDVFFVISGYLITKNVLGDLERGSFSFRDFYDRRARRILPALYLVMIATFVIGYFSVMPDEFKNLGQSLVATSLFANNLLLGITSGYWDLASEFKPLLHTWSLGVEEQYYVVLPILFCLFWRFGRRGLACLLWSVFGISMLLAVWLLDYSPKWAFYLFPTRAWEIAVGGLAAVYSQQPSVSAKLRDSRFSNPLSLGGLLLILASVYGFDKGIQSPGPWILVPTVGTALILMFCRPASIVFWLLGNRVLVFIGLMSYSLYLWHQPIFAYLRIASRSQPNPSGFIVLIPAVLLLGYLSWRYVEVPFRNRTKIRSRFVLGLSGLGAIFFITLGLWLNSTYGMAWRVFDRSISVFEMDKRSYNERIFAYKRDEFRDKAAVNILFVGNSFARDFVNVTLESFDVSRTEIIYRDDLGQCDLGVNQSDVASVLYRDADVIVFASGGFNECSGDNIALGKALGKKIFYVGTKDFGYNLNWIVRLSSERRANLFNAIPASVIEADRVMSMTLPQGHYISLLKPVLVDGKVPITDEMGRMLSTDRSHLTKYGAMYFGRASVAQTEYAELFK